MKNHKFVKSRGQPVGVLDFIEMSQLNTHCEPWTPCSRFCSTFLIIIIPVANDATDVILDLCDYLCQPVPNANAGGESRFQTHITWVDQSLKLMSLRKERRRAAGAVAPAKKSE